MKRHIFTPVCLCLSVSVRKHKIRSLGDTRSATLILLCACVCVHLQKAYSMCVSVCVTACRCVPRWSPLRRVTLIDNWGFTCYTTRTLHSIAILGSLYPTRILSHLGLAVTEAKLRIQTSPSRRFARSHERLRSLPSSNPSRGLADEPSAAGRRISKNGARGRSGAVQCVLEEQLNAE